MIYLTFNEGYSGIFSSQVCDVVNYLNGLEKEKIRLYCFISMRGYFNTRKKIKNEISNARIIPMFPGMRFWKLNRFTLYLLLGWSGRQKIIGRSVWATWIALKARECGLAQKVIYDGRGAVYHESLEYEVIRNRKLAFEIRDLERKCIIESDFRVAVSEKLVAHWRNFYLYNSPAHVIIPCTLNSKVFPDKLVPDSLAGTIDSEVLGIYSGSAAGWQSSSGLTRFLERLFNQSPAFRLIILSHDQKGWAKIQKEFPGRIKLASAEPMYVPSYLKKADYGFLLREDSITNRVASPVKFSEYLVSGLKVLISPDIGDFSEFVRANDCGFVIGENTAIPLLGKVSGEEKERIKKIARQNFTKEKYRLNYLSLMGS